MMVQSNTDMIDNDERPGPSGIRKKSIFQKVKNQLIKGGNEPPKQPVEIFADRVTVAGIKEAITAKSKMERSLFCTSLLLASLIMAYESYAITVHYYYGSSTTFFEKHVSNQAPFPNVEICYQPSFNESNLYQIADELLATDSLLLRNISVEDIADFERKNIMLQVKLSDIGTKAYKAGKAFFHALRQQSISKNYSANAFLSYAIAPCTTILSNCAYNGQPFNCCDVAVFHTFLTHFCYQIKMTNVLSPYGSDIKIPEVVQSMVLDKSGLTFDASSDWTFGLYEEGIASDGFHVLIDKLANPTSVPTAIPSGMDALITLDEVKKVKELTNCILSGKKLKYYDNYDANGVNCMGEVFNDYVWNFVGCLVPMFDFLPSWNDACSFDQLFISTLALTDSGIDSFQDEASKSMKKRLEKASKDLISATKTCLPLCSRWIYPVFSASYSAIEDKNWYFENDQSNRSWSRIRIIIPQLSYTMSEETYAAVPYLAMCDIGGMMGVYGGFSMITFVQILAYGLYILYAKMPTVLTSQTTTQNISQHTTYV